VGYSAPESPAGRLRAAADGETFVFSGAGGELTRKCRVEAFDLTAHANREDLVDFVAQVQPKVVVLGQGDTVARSWFAQTLRQRWPQMTVLEPGPGERVSC
jgi:Cft2 family RNA processing exonuclease